MVEAVHGLHIQGSLGNTPRILAPWQEDVGEQNDLPLFHVFLPCQFILRHEAFGTCQESGYTGPGLVRIIPCTNPGMENCLDRLDDERLPNFAVPNR